MVLCIRVYIHFQILNVDLTHIEARVTELLKHDRSLTLIHGELIERLRNFYGKSCFNTIVYKHLSNPLGYIPTGQEKLPHIKLLSWSYGTHVTEYGSTCI